MKALKMKIEVWLYGRLRDNIVHRMRANKATWTNINRVLIALKQKQIVRVEYTDEGPLLTYGELAVVKKVKVTKGVPYNDLEYAKVEIVNPHKSPNN